MLKNKVYGESGADARMHTVTVLSTGRESSVVTESKLGVVVSRFQEGRTVSYYSDLVIKGSEYLILRRC